jgi:hypothetical protein
MHLIYSKFATVLHFLLVLVVTVLSWLLTGKLVQLLFPSLSILAFLVVGLGAGFLLAFLLSQIHSDADRNPSFFQGHFTS